MNNAGRHAHWDTIYQTKGEHELSWFEESPTISLELIRATGVTTEASIIDIGGGASRLVDALLDKGYSAITVLDISERALETKQSHQRQPTSPLRRSGRQVLAFDEPNQAHDAIVPHNIDTIFLKPTHSNNENTHFHELVHVIQWRLLGPDRFLFSYANGLECFGYRQSPLEAMAYDAEMAFRWSSKAIFNVEKMVAAKLGL